MDKKSSIQFIENTFNAKFDENKFTLFIKNLLNDIEPKNNTYSGNYIWHDYKEHINTYKRIGKYIDPEGDTLDVLIVEVKSVIKLERARTVLRNFVIKHLCKFEKDYALVAFYSKEDDGADWRFSFIRLVHQSYLDEEKQKIKIRKEFTAAKRYSFLVGKYEQAHTAKTQLLPLLQNSTNNPTVEDIESAFSIEKVTDEFFGQYKDLYVKLFAHFESDNSIQTELNKVRIDNTRFTKKLLGQIVFLYFLQKKGWLGVPENETWGKGQKRFIQDLFEISKTKNQNFFKDYLQYLFYEALAKERNNENSFYKRFDCRIPFLNGGLFEAEYDWQKATITIPENLFRNTEKNKAGDIGTGVLDVFDRYNFTIKEDEPLDKEVAVDPEMLGKVFENMLDITERKSKGAFYTPREIVHYMCQESLIHYLDNCLNSSPPSKGGVPKGRDLEGVNNLPYLKTFRKNLRNNLTPAEASLWKLVQKKQIDGRKFRRQHSVANYILDFYCPSEKLAIELDGQGHFEENQAEYDRERDLFLKHCGIKVLRFENKWVWENTEGVLQAIRNEFGWSKKQPPRPADTPPLKGGELKKVDIETYIREGHFALENDQRAANKGETKTYQFQLPESIRQNADLIDQKLTEIRICDPAIGSGAFPVGLLHELVNAQLVLKPHLSKKYLKNKLDGFGFQFHESINESRYVYRLKRHIIQESIYGVDIDASAIDIARLRLWLSLVVDEADLDPIETLPNLDYKIVCGNSLIGMPENSFRNLEVEKELEALKKQFYDETNETKKKALRTKINTKIRELLDSSEQFAGYTIDFDFKLYFSEVWHEKGGFDVVIGNPPYGAKLTTEEKKFFKNEFSDVHMRTPDTFNYFISKGFRLLHDNGIISHIVPNNLLFQSEFEKTRKFLLDKNQFYIGINLGDGVFNTATVPSCIFISSKKRSSLKKYYYTDLRNADKNNIDFNFIFQQESIKSTLKVPASIFGITEKEFKITKKLKTVSVTIDEIAEEMASGISTGGDKIFRIDKNFGEKNNFETELLKPVLVGGEIDKYKITDTNHNVIYTDRETEINNYIAIKNYLSQFREKLKKRSEAKSGIMPWFALNRQRYPMLFEEDKIIMRQTSDRIKATFDSSAFYVIDSILIFKKYNNKPFSYKYILAILNSSVNGFLYRKFTQERGRTFAQVKPKNVRKLYIPKTNENNQIIVAQIVNYLLTFHQISEENETIISSFYESILDSISFELFLPTELKTANKEILKHLGDLKPITDDMSEEKKLAIIQSEFERLYDPTHPVRNAIETLDSIEEVRLIKEALK